MSNYCKNQRIQSGYHFCNFPSKLLPILISGAFGRKKGDWAQATSKFIFSPRRASLRACPRLNLKKIKNFWKSIPPRFVQKLMLYHVVPSVFASFVPIIGKIEVKFDKNVNLGKIESRRDWCSSDVWTVDVWPFWNKKTFLDKWIFFKYIIYYKVFY